MFLLAPVATICIHNFSCRKTAFFGGLILSCGLIMSSFAKDISLLLIGYGFLAGKTTFLKDIFSK